MTARWRLFSPHHFIMYIDNTNIHHSVSSVLKEYQIVFCAGQCDPLTMDAIRLLESGKNHQLFFTFSKHRERSQVHAIL